MNKKIDKSNKTTACLLTKVPKNSSNKKRGNTDNNNNNNDSQRPNEKDHAKLLPDIQGVPGRKVNILGGHSIIHSNQKTLYEHVSYSELFPR